MHWIIQEDLHHEHGFTMLLETLDRFCIPHTEVKCVPFTQGLPLSERIIPFQIDIQKFVMAIEAMEFDT